MRGMHPKSPAKRRWGIHRANILPPRGAFAVRSPQITHGAQILPPSDGLAPAQGLLPEQPHRGIAFQLPGPCSGVPAPAPRRYPPSAACRTPSSAAPMLVVAPYPTLRNARRRVVASARAVLLTPCSVAQRISGNTLFRDVASPRRRSVPWRNEFWTAPWRIPPPPDVPCSFV